MVQVAWFVETFYPVIVPIVIVVAIFWFVLAHDRTLLLPFVGSVLLLLILSFGIGFFRIFLISLPSMMIGVVVHSLFAAWSSYTILRMFRGLQSAHQSQGK